MQFNFSAKLRLRSDGKHKGSWHFITVSKELSDKIKTIAASQPRKWRWSVKVEVRIWFAKRITSIFPDKKSGCYVLPVKSEVRDQLKIKEGDKLLVNLQLVGLDGYQKI